MLIDASFGATTGEILAAAIEVHRTLGPGLLESIYSRCLQFELAERKMRYATQRPIPLLYKRLVLDSSYRVDLIVEDCVVVEVKSLTAILAVHQAWSRHNVCHPRISLSPCSTRATSSSDACAILRPIRSTESVRSWLIFTQDRLLSPVALLSSVSGNPARGCSLVMATPMTVPERSLKTS